MGICISTKKHKKNIKKIKDSNGTIKTNLKEKINTTLDKVTNINDKTNITMDKTETEKGVKEHDPQKK